MGGKGGVREVGGGKGQVEWGVKWMSGEVEEWGKSRKGKGMAGEWGPGRGEKRGGPAVGGGPET